jgi:hypothetical protein
VCEHNSDPASSPERLWLPVDEGQIEAARETLRDKKGAQWSLGVSIGIQIGDNVELRNNLIPLLIELEVPTATLSDMFNLSGRELWNIAAAEPVSVFGCLDCDRVPSSAPGRETQGTCPCCAIRAPSSGFNSTMRSSVCDGLPVRRGPLS